MIPASYRVDGPAGAPLLVLASSLGTTSAMWDPQMPTWTSRFRVLRFEHRGHGGTPAPPGPYRMEDLADDVVELLDHLGEPSASICGLSIGGMVALSLASRYPDRVDRVVLACTAAQLAPAATWTDRAATVRAEGTGGLRGALLGRWFTPGFVDRRPDVAGSVTAMLAAADPEGYAGCCEAIAGADLHEALAGVRAPTLVVMGAADLVTPPAVGLELAAGIPGAALAVLPGAAHLANIEQPDRFTAAVVDHLAGLAIERGDATRRAVLGDAHVDRSDAARTAFSAPFSDFITRYAWGDIWTRPGLDRRTRSSITLALLAGLGRTEELPLHVRGARNNGLSDAEISEVLLHTAVYAGVPAANSAFAVARRTLAEMDDAEAAVVADLRAVDGEAPGRGRDFVLSLERGLAVIKAFDREHPRLTLADVARTTGMTRAAARRFLLTLVELGYMDIDGRSFSLRPRILELGHAYLSSLSLNDVAVLHMERLVAQVHESSSVAVLDGDDIVYVVRVPTARIMTVSIAVGTRFPAHATSMGRVLLAGLAPADLDAYLERAAVAPLTRRTVTEPALLRRAVATVATQGYSVVDQELEDGLRSIAVPVVDGTGAVVAALNVSTHASRTTLDGLRRDVLSALQATARDISADLAALSPSQAAGQLRTSQAPGRRGASPAPGDRPPQP